MHFLSLAGLAPDSFLQLLDLASAVKKNPQALGRPLEGKFIALLFDKPSTRTRISFEVGIGKLGGGKVLLSRSTLQVSRGESIEDTIRVVARYCDGLMIRTFSHDNLLKIAKFSKIPIINGLTDLYHPCQALADFQTLAENNLPLEKSTLCYVGDGNNNVCHSLILAASLANMTIHVASPKEFQPNAKVLEIAKKNSVKYRWFENAQEAVQGANAIYTDVWVSMGQEDDAQERKAKLAPFQVNQELVNQSNNAIILHCLPAKKGEEITAEVFESQNSRIFDQAENRLHAQMALMKTLFS